MGVGRVGVEGDEVPPKTHRILFTSAQIEARLEAVCREIARDHLRAGDLREVVLTPILDGAAKAADRIRELLGAIAQSQSRTLRLSVCPIRIARTSGRALKAPSLRACDIEEGRLRGQLVIIVDDLVDEGHTLALARKRVEGFLPRKVITCVVVCKRKVEHSAFDPDYCCFRLDYDRQRADRSWLVGYGMDADGDFRDCDYIAECAAQEG